MAIALFTGPGHARLPHVRSALNAFPLTTRCEAPAPEHLRERLVRAWAARHSAPHHRDVIGALLPDLIREAQLAVLQADSASQRRTAQRTLSEVYSLSQFFLAYQPDASLLWRVVERGMVAAQESEDPHAIGVSAWLATQAHRDSGHAHFDAADAVNLETIRYLEPLLPDAGNDVLAITGALQFEAGYTAARRGDTGTAWRYWDVARAMAERLPADYFHPVTSFSRAVMGAHAVTVAVELHAGPESVRQAAAADTTTLPRAPGVPGTASRKHADISSTGRRRPPSQPSARHTRPHRKPCATTATPGASSSKRRTRRIRHSDGGRANWR